MKHLLLALLLTLPISASAQFNGCPSGFCALSGAGGVVPATYTPIYGNCQDLAFGTSTYTSPSQTWTTGVAVVFILDGASRTTTSVTINGVLATSIGVSANSQGKMYFASVSAGSGTVVYVASAGLGVVCTGGGIVTTTTPTPSGSQVVNCCAGADPQAAATATIPANGVGVAGIGLSANTLPGVWSNAIRDAVTETSIGTGGTGEISMAHSSAAGSLTPSVSGTGGNGFGFNGGGQAFAAWGP